MSYKKITEFMDEKGYIIQKSEHKWNMIDSNFLTTNLLYQKMFLGDSKWFNGRSIEDVAKDAIVDFRDSSGLIRRYWRDFDELTGANPEETTRYTDTRTVSRDNSIGYIVLLGKLGYHKEARSILFSILKRGSFFQNTTTVKGIKKIVPDLCGLEQYSIILRACFPKPILLLLYPLLAFLDIFFFLDQLVHVLQSYYNPTYTSTVHHRVSAILQNKDTIQTPFSFLAEKLLVFCRKRVYKEYRTLESATRYYSRAEYDAPIYETTKRVEDKL